MRSRVRDCFVVVALLLSGALTVAQGGSIRYIYDELGRLVGVIDGNGDAATYHYDAAGNLLSITRSTSSQVAIIEFSPHAGPIGQTVTLYGTGFSATPGLNTVSFNGTAASVSTATASVLVVTVPAGATTGSINVTSPNGSASSGAPYTVSPNSAPTITSFTPTSAVPGTSITITGTNFESVPASDPTRFNNSQTTPTAATTTTVTATIPPNTGSGRITIKTPKGTAVSTDDMIIPPSPYVVADVATAARIATATATTITVSTANKIALRLFDGTSGQRVSILGTNGISGQILGCDVLVSIWNPFANALAPGTCMESVGFLDTKTLATSGTYSILVDPAGAATGSVTLTLYSVPADFTSNITAGSSVTASMGTPGQNGALAFSGTNGQRVSVVGTNGLWGQIAAVCDVTASIVNSSGTVIAVPACMEASGFIDATTLPATGPYTIVLDPAKYATGDVTIALHDVPADFASTITPGGSPVTAEMGTPGQNAALTFSGSAGQRIALLGTSGLSGFTFGCDLYVTIRNPDASVLASAACMEGSGFIDVKTLPSSGTYTIAVDPVSWATGNLTLTLYDVPAEYTSSISAGGSAVIASITTAGQNGTVTFAGTSGQRISLVGTNGLSGYTIGCDLMVSIKNPDASILASPACMEGSGFIDVKTLPATGTYTIVVDPQDHAVGDVTLTLHAVPADTTGTVSVGGSAVGVTLNTPGQNGTLTFSGTASQQVTVRMASNTLGSVTVRLLKPDGSQLASTTSPFPSFNLSTQTLPSTGTYTIVVDPTGATTGSINVNVTNP